MARIAHRKDDPPALAAVPSGGTTLNHRGPWAVRPDRRDSLLGLDLQGYVVTQVLSTGGMGVVYEAHHSVLGQRAAVKVLRQELIEDADYAARFLREARALSAIRHRNIVEILNFGVIPGRGQFILMEFLEGETLREVIRRTAPMPPADALRICDEILSALSAAHALGVVHRDLKPANVILCQQASDDLVVKVLDFGVSRQFGAGSDPVFGAGQAPRADERASILAGTPEYISPEQAAGRSVDGQADLYCLGVVLFEMLTGRLPFESSTAPELLQQHREEPPPRVSSLVEGIPPELDAFVDRLLSKSPADRPASARLARAVVRTLRNIGSEGPVTPLPLLPPSAPRPPPFADTVLHVDRRWGPKRRTVLGVFAGALGMAAVGLLVSILALRSVRVSQGQTAPAAISAQQPLLPAVSTPATPQSSERQHF